MLISSRANLVSEDSLESVEDDLHVDQHDNDHDLHLHPKDAVCSNKVQKTYVHNIIFLSLNKHLLNFFWEMTDIKRISTIFKYAKILYLKWEAGVEIGV